MNAILVSLLAITLLLPVPAIAEIKTVTHTIQQPFGGSQSPDDARIAGIARAKREALEQFGTYIESTTIVKNSQVDSDSILALTAGVTKAEVITQKNYTDGDAFGMEITVMVELDTAVLETSLKRLLQDRNHLKDLTAAREREKKLLARVAELEKENQQKGKAEQKSAKLKEEFQAVSKKLTAVEWFDKAMSLWDGEKYSDTEKAIEYLTQAIRFYPNNALAYNIRGFAYYKLKQLDRAIEDYDQAIRLDKNFAGAYFFRGLAYYHLKKFDRAIVDFDKDIRINPKEARGYFYRGLVYDKIKQYHRAIADYDHAVRLETTNATYYFKRGSSYKKLNKHKEAIDDFNQSIRLEPEDATLYFFRGGVYEKLKQYELAKADYDIAISLQPTDKDFYFSRGDVYVKLKQYQLAIADYDQIISLNPNEIHAYEARGLTHINSGKLTFACNDFSQSCRLGDCESYKFFCK